MDLLFSIFNLPTRKKILLTLFIFIVLLRIFEIFKPVKGYATLYTQRALQFQQNHQINEAVKTFKKAIYHNPDFVPAYYELGLLYGRMNQKENQLQYFKKVTGLSPYSPPYVIAYFTVGLNYFEKKEYASAIQYFRMAILKQNYTEAQYFLGLSQFYMGDKAGVIQRIKDLKWIGQSEYNFRLRRLIQFYK